ncbi:CDP-diacylglycerol--serine O-phosphatidyltransferase [Candidatus Sumerlaeota bacterium]|nr:CDP-diacylglycerol--serine O-phosphatidyltransferase [Candidatus Sumerlaeota bacterium]
MANKTFNLRPNLRLLRNRRKGPIVRATPAHPVVELEQRDPPPHFYIFPNLFTSASLFLALWAIVNISEGSAAIALKNTALADAKFVKACWLILFSALCDAVDGPVARLTRTSSSFGLNFDSLADVVAFGVAPAFLMYSKLRAMDEGLPLYAPRLALGACALFAICSAIRLARFNVQATTTERNYFTGLPTPGAAGSVVSAFLFVLWFTDLPAIRDLDSDQNLRKNLHRLILLMMAGLSFLMVSEVPFPKLKNLLSISRKPFDTLVILVVAICVLIMMWNNLPVILFGGFAIYILASVFNGVRSRLANEAEPSDGGAA